MDNPTLELEFTVFSFHSVSEPDLSEFIIEEDGDEEGHGWDSEVREWNLSSTKGNVEEWDVKEDSNEGSLGEKSKVTERVGHTLLS